jgi:hypothetical protein
MTMRLRGKSSYILYISVLIMLFVLSPIISTKADAQFLPLPSPDSAQKVHTSDKLLKNNNQPPVINFLTNILNVGNNVFKVTITDKSAIDLCKVSYFRDGKNVTDDCINDHGDLYKSLLKIDSPVPQTIVVYVEDDNGNSSTNVKKLIVQAEKNIFEQIFDNLLHLF